MVWQENIDTSGGEVRDQASLSSFHRDIGIPINFQEESGRGTFQNTENHGPLEVSSDVRPPVHLRLGHRAFSRDCTEYADIPLYCEKKDKPAFKPLQGNLTFFRVRKSRYPLHVTQQIQGPSHIPIAEGRLVLRCCGKVAYLFNRILGISSPQDDMGCMELSLSS